MSCYFRYIKDLFVEAGVSVTPENKRRIDEIIHSFVGVPYKKCMPDCWSKLKSAIKSASRRSALISALKRSR